MAFAQMSPHQCPRFGVDQARDLFLINVFAELDVARFRYAFHQFGAGYHQSGKSDLAQAETADSGHGFQQVIYGHLTPFNLFLEKLRRRKSGHQRAVEVEEGADMGAVG